MHPNHDPKTRDMTKEDIPRLLLLEQRLFPHPWKGMDFEGELLFPGSFCRVLQERGEILAYACARQVPDGFELLRIASHPDFQGRGFAGFLLEEIVLLAGKAAYSDIFLEVSVNNGKALSFYEKHGFAICGTRKAYYPGRVDAMSLVKRKT